VGQMPVKEVEEEEEYIGSIHTESCYYITLVSEEQ